MLQPFHQKISLIFDIAHKLAKGYVKTSIIAKSDMGKTIELDGINFKITAISSRSDSSQEEIIWRYNDKKILVTWIRPWVKNEKRTLLIHYSVQDPIGGLYFSPTNTKNPELPMYVVADNESERAKYWLPCIDHPSVRCTLDFELTSDSNHTILANGELIKETEDNGFKTAFWTLDFPCPSYLITLFIGSLISYTDRPAQIGSREVLH